MIEAISCLYRLHRELTDSQFKFLFLLVNGSANDGFRMIRNTKAIMESGSYSSKQFHRFYDALVRSGIIIEHGDSEFILRGMSKGGNIEKQAKASPAIKNGNGGYVYLVHGESTPWYKIGVTKTPKNRFSSLGAKSPFKIDVVAYAFYRNYLDVEEDLHKRYAEYRVEGEWFELPVSSVAAITKEMENSQ